MGLDEAGVGPAFGSLWAAAVSFPDDSEFRGMADSKRMTETKREAMHGRLQERSLWGLGEVTAEEIDADGLAKARRLVFHRALDHLHDRHPTLMSRVKKLIVDGTIFESWNDIPYECVPKGDEKYSCVAAASVLAKVTRDRQVVALCQTTPSLQDRYGIAKNKGYLSEEHIEGIRQHGYSPGHRRSYKIRKLQGLE